jgi:adenosylhomocysteinase
VRLWPDGKGPRLVVDDGGDATLLIHRGYYAEKNPDLLDEPIDNKELQIVNQFLKKGLKEDANFWQRLVAECRGVSEETPPVFIDSIRCRARESSCFRRSM